MPTLLPEREELGASSKAARALVGSVTGFAMEGFDLIILSFMLPSISKAFGLQPAQAASLVTFTLLGTVAGGIGLGLLADRVGRVRVLAWSIVVFAVFTGLCALARGYVSLVLFRMLAGMGLGGEFGIGMALVAEAWPPDSRARASSYVALGLQMGVLIASLLTPLLLPVIGWRGMFAVGIVPALAAWSIRKHLEEPQIFLKSHGHIPTSSSMLLLFKSNIDTKHTVAMFILCAVQNIGYYTVMTWLPNYLSARFGFSLGRSALWTVVTILGMMLGLLAFGQIADRLGRKPALVGWMLGAALAVFIYARLANATALLIVGGVMGFFVNGMLGGYGALISELYPTTARATAQNILFNSGRAVGGFGPLVVGAIAIRWGAGTAVAMLSLLYLGDALIVILCLPERRGTALS